MDLKFCPKCGAPLSATAPGGLCPQCLFQRMMPHATEQIGDRIGRYKLLQQIGEGGCGVVYMAEQAEPVRRRVALKVIKLGMDTKSVIARFQAEGQALALMDHPNIAKVLDAGATDAGRPYFVMELVRGIRITDYCDQHGLSTRERLKLFMLVCHAIQHAHQKGIIHRDVKPSNILVTMHDGGPVPKVIDFGIAKATEQRLSDETVITTFEQIIGTPTYMSPEQAEMTGLDIDTRTDIYALGVLLYELLAGKTPFDSAHLLASGLDEMRRTIREREPARPSTRLSTMAEPERTTIARRRQSDAAKLIGSIRGDLDWIVMKALEKDRTRRYDTANGLAMDIARHLSNEPVVARPPSNFYRFERLVRRNKLAFAAAAALLVTLVAGLMASSWLFWKESKAHQRAVAAEKAQALALQQAQTEERKARTEASKSDQVAKFLKQMLEGIGPSVALGRDTVMLREILDKTVERVGKDLQGQPAVEAELRATIGNLYNQLGNYRQAAEMLRISLRLRESVLGREDLAVAESLTGLGWALCSMDRHAEGEVLFREALATRKKLLGENHVLVAKNMVNLGNALLGQRKFDEAEKMQRDALAMKRALLGNINAEVANSLNMLGTTLRSQGKHAEAATTYREALTINTQVVGSLPNPLTAMLINNLAGGLRDQGRFAEAEAMYREALEMDRKLLSEGHPTVVMMVKNVAHALMAQGKFSEAEELYQDALTRQRKSLENRHPAIAASVLAVGAILRDQGKLDEAEPLLTNALAVARKSGTNNPAILEDCLAEMAKLRHRQKQFAEAERLYRELLQGRQLRLGADNSDTSDVTANLGSLLADWAWAEREVGGSTVRERAGESIRLLRDSVAARQRNAKGGDAPIADAQSRLGEALALSALADAGLTPLARDMQLAAGESLLLQGYDGVQQNKASGAKYRRPSIERIVRVYEAWQQPEKLAEWRKKLEACEEPDIEKANDARAEVR